MAIKPNSITPAKSLTPIKTPTPKPLPSMTLQESAEPPTELVQDFEDIHKKDDNDKD